jgi:hypothetical protein
MDTNMLAITARKIDRITQVADIQTVLLTAEATRLFPVQIRLYSPAELNLMASIAGLRLINVYSDWQEAPFTSDSRRYISVYVAEDAQHLGILDSGHPGYTERVPMSITSRALKVIALALAVLALLLWPSVAHAGVQDGAGAYAAQNATFTTQDVTFGSVGVTLHGTILIPQSDTRRRPAMVLIAGSGVGTRSDTMPEAETFAREGIIALIYDKRTVGYSTTSQSYALLADDALAAIRVLRARADVDPNEVGLWGVSEGAWVASLAASTSPDVDFVALIAFSGVSPSRMDAWEIENELRFDGVAGSIPHDLPIAAIRLVAGVGMFPEANYNPVPAIEGLHQPVLAIWGAEDMASPPAESMTITRNALNKAGNQDYELWAFPDAEHVLHVSANGFTDPDTTPFAPGYLQLVGKWVNSLSTDPQVLIAGPKLTQARTSVSVTPDAWYQDAWAQLAALALFLVAFAYYVISALVRLVTRRRSRPVLRWPARVMIVCGTIVALGVVLYSVFILLAQAPGPMLGSLPVIWLVLRALAVVAIISAVITGVMWWRRRSEVPGSESVRIGLLLLCGAVMIPWTLYWGLI